LLRLSLTAGLYAGSVWLLNSLNAVLVCSAALERVRSSTQVVSRSRTPAQSVPATPPRPSPPGAACRIGRRFQPPAFPIRPVFRRQGRVQHPQVLPTNSGRSKGRKTDLFEELRRSTLICCRRTRISASSRALERNMGRPAAQGLYRRLSALRRDMPPSRAQGGVSLVAGRQGQSRRVLSRRGCRRRYRPAGVLSLQ
jgi:hypothetical protein